MLGSIRVRMNPRKTPYRVYLIGFPLLAAALLVLHTVLIERKSLLDAPVSVSSTATALKNAISPPLQQKPKERPQPPSTTTSGAPPSAPNDASAPVHGADTTAPQPPPAPPAPEPKYAPLPNCASQGRAQTWLMVFMGHSGSSAIISQLRHDGTYIKDPEPVDHYKYEKNHTLALEYVKNHFETGIAQGRAAGFKIRPPHIQARPKEWAALAAKYNTRIIWNYRGNMFKQAVGEYKYLKLNDSTVIEGLRHAVNQTERCKHTKCGIRIDDFDFLHNQLERFAILDRWIMQAVQTIDNGRGCVMPLPYEKYLYHPKETMKQIHRFLGLEYEHVPTQRFKSTSDNMCQEVSNWNQVCNNFYSCLTWRSMMQDLRNNCDCPVSHRKAAEKYCNVYPKKQ